MRLGLLTACLPGESLADVAGWAGAHGYCALEVAAWPDRPGRDWEASHLDVESFDAAEAARVRGLLAEHDLELSAVAYYENNLHEDPAVRAATHEHLRRCIDAAQLLGVGLVGTFVGRDLSRTVAGNLRLAEKVLPPLVDYAAARDVRLVVENCPMEGWHPDGYPANLAYSPELWGWMAGLGLWLNYDPSHLVWLGIDPVAALAAHADRVLHVQAKDVEVDAAARDRYGVFGRVHPSSDRLRRRRLCRARGPRLERHTRPGPPGPCRRRAHPRSAPGGLSRSRSDRSTDANVPTHERPPMHRGVYFDAWFPRQHCYHPSLPPRRLRMIDDLVDYRATVLVWASMGGGSLALPYLEQEAFGPVDARSRFYGFVNDSEFIAACHERGIKVLGIVFEAQGWEFPVELTEDEDAVLALNELRGVGKRDWMGLREFSSNRYPKLWKPVEHYFPDGLVNSDGEPVTDLIEECVVRDIHQQPCHAHWVECPDREHQCFYMDRNNPVWREYLKAVIRIQIDAGVDGIQLDEAELPMGAFQYGACFCKDCMKGFRAYLQGLKPSQVDIALDGVDLAAFHYGEWLLEQGYDFASGRESTPLFGDYYAFQCQAIKTYFAELAGYARDYARSVGREIVVSGNFFNLEPMYLALADDVDLIITEMRNTTYRQPEWYRYVAAFAGDKDVVVVENPYGGVVPDLIDLLAEGRGHDLFRLSLFEAAALGANMSVPYGSWMGSVIEDSFYAPHALATEIQAFLAEHEHLFARRTANEVAVVFSVATTRELIGKADASDNTTNRRDESVVVPYRAVTSALAGAAVPFDVVIWPDGVTAPDRAIAGELERYSTVVLPDVHTLTEAQAAAVEGYLAGGGTVVTTDRVADGLSHHARVRSAGRTSVDELLPHGRQVETPVPVAANLQQLADGSCALHLVNYDYDAVADAVRTLADVPLRVRLPEAKQHATAVSSDGTRTPLEVTREDGVHMVVLDRLGVYSIVVFHDDVKSRG